MTINGFKKQQQKKGMGGNCFYDAIEKNMWILRKKFQEILNSISRSPF